MLDVTDETSITEAFRRVTEEAGHVTGLVNNAGFSKDGLLLRYPMDVYQRTMDTNLRGAFLCSSAALRGMLRQKWGRIVNVSSAVALHGNAGQTVYAATKAGLVGMTQVARTRGRDEGRHRERDLPRAARHRHDLPPGRRRARLLHRPDTAAACRHTSRRCRPSCGS